MDGRGGDLRDGEDRSGGLRLMADEHVVTEQDRGIIFTRKADLPDGAEKALGFDIVEAGESFRLTDIVNRDCERLPYRRFISAQLTDDILSLSYECGGRGYSRAEIKLTIVEGGWVVL